MTSTGFNGQLFIQVDFLGAIDPLGTMIFTSAGNTKLLKVELAVYEGGIASYMFNYFHDPISNITWNGNPDNNGSKGHDFFNAVMSVGEVGDGHNYENIVVNFGAQFEGGYPVVAKNFTFNTGILNFANSTDITLLRGSTAILTAVTVFSAATTITGGQIGGRGCSASNDTTIDLVGNNDLNFANYPLCGKQTITNVDIAGLSIIS
jgi:hypothetical protein